MATGALVGPPHSYAAGCMVSVKVNYLLMICLRAEQMKASIAARPEMLFEKSNQSIGIRNAKHSWQQAKVDLIRRSPSRSSKQSVMYSIKSLDKDILLD